MKKVLLLLLVAAAFASCTKEASVSSLDSQQSKKQKVGTQMTVSVATSVPVDWTPADDVISIDNAVYAQSGAYFGNQVSGSFRANDPAMFPTYGGCIIQVYIAANWVDKFGVSDPNAHWTAINSGEELGFPGGSFQAFDGYPSPSETRVYRAKVTTMAPAPELTHTYISSPYQVN